MSPATEAMRLRLMLAGIGAVAGFCFWALSDYLPDLVSDQRLLFLIAAIASVLFGNLLLLVGQLGLKRALTYAIPQALVVGLLGYWASFRFVDLDGFLSSAHPFPAALALAALPLPFFLAAETGTGGWREYEVLFDEAWSLFVRSFTGWAFVGLFWLVVFLSDALLKLVGFEWLEELFDNVWISLPLTGVVLGLALAVLNELVGIVATLRRLALQLLRLLLPLVAAVMSLFIVLVPFRGLDRVFGELSAAGTMLAMALGAVTLITSAIEARESEAAASRVMVISARALSVLLPIIAAIAVYAVWLRVAQYGWTPSRLAASAVALMVLGYALAYAVSVLAGSGWRGHIRSANTWMALGLIALSLAWLSPLLNAERISANSHVRYFEAGRIGVDDLDIWALADDWGVAGGVALLRLRALSEEAGQDALKRRIAAYDAGESRWAVTQDPEALGNLARLERLAEVLPVRPEGRPVPDGALQTVSVIVLKEILAACEAPIADGRPGCAMVLGTFDPDGTHDAVLIFWRDGSGTSALSIERDTTTTLWDLRMSVEMLDGNLYTMSPDIVLAQILDGGFAFVPARRNALQIGDMQILPRR